MASRSLLVQQLTETFTLNMSSTNVPNSSTWATLASKTVYGCAAIEVFNPSGSTVQIALGASGHEVALPYTILPGGSTILLPFKIPAGSRVSLQALDTAITSGYFVLNMFG